MEKNSSYRNGGAVAFGYTHGQPYFRTCIVQQIGNYTSPRNQYNREKGSPDGRKFARGTYRARQYRIHGLRFRPSAVLSRIREQLDEVDGVRASHPDVEGLPTDRNRRQDEGSYGMFRPLVFRAGQIGFASVLFRQPGRVYAYGRQAFEAVHPLGHRVERGPAPEIRKGKISDDVRRVLDRAFGLRN